ncbi:MAG: hypothetical protein ABJA74_17375 [Lapillicoccus sp.]
MSSTPTSDRRPRHVDERTRNRDGRRRRWLAPVTILVVLGIVAGASYAVWTTLQSELFSPSCTATASGASVTFSPEQVANAALIAAISDQRELPPRAASIAIATAIQESKLRNLNFGDRDSVGLFQQRPSMEVWGTREQILDPVHSTNAFYDALVKIDGYESMVITEVAQKVQKSAYPDAYADHEQEGRILASTLRGQSPAGVVCQLRPAETMSPAATVAADLDNQLGVKATVDGSTLTVAAPSPELAWAAGQWSVARAEAYGVDRVQVGDRAWTRGERGSAESWSTGESSPSPTTVTIRMATPSGS